MSAEPASSPLVMKHWLIGFVVLAVALGLFIGLRPILMPFVVAGILAYIFNPLVLKLCRLGLPRGLAAMLVMFLGLILLVILALIIIPMLITQIDNISSRLPVMLDWLHYQLIPWLNHTLHIRINWNVDSAVQYVTQWIETHNGSVKDAASKMVPILLQHGGDMVVWVSNLVLLPLLLYYFLLDWNRWAQGISSMMPRRMLPAYTRITTNMDKVLSQFLHGQLLVMIIMGIVYGTGLALIGLNSGFAIGMIAGLLVFVPYLGAFTGLLLATLAALLQLDGWTQLFLVWGIFAIGQFTESFFVTPKIVGDRIGLSPFWVIFSLMAFGQLLGFVGMLLALPLAAISQVLVHESTAAYKRSNYYLKPPRTQHDQTDL
ncbi:AI-2E family transporter [Neisseriaceae bacterium ESL0693]|nr:AI-2E family transporter [Neisseriaceae bacterium ESL0693]